MPEFKWSPINTFNAIIIVLLFVPDLIYGLKHKDEKAYYHNRILYICETIGQYASMFLMLFPIGVENFEFGFPDIPDMLVYLLLDIAMVIMFFILRIVTAKEKTMAGSILLAIVPIVIYLASGLILSHWFLVIAAVFYAIGHIYMAYRNEVERKRAEQQ